MWVASGHRGENRAMSQAAASDDDPQSRWDEVVDQLSQSLAPSQLAFIRLTKPLGVLNETLLLAVPSSYTKDYLELEPETRFIKPLSKPLVDH